MNTQHLDSEIRALIDQFTSKFRELLGLAALGSVQMALEAGVGTPVAPARRGPGRPNGTGKPGGPAKGGPGRPPAAKTAPGRRVRRSSADVEEVAEQVLGYVRAHPGSRLEEIGRGLRTETAGLKLPVKELVTSGRLRTEGQKRGTKYFAEGKTAGAKVKAKAPVPTGAQRKVGKRSTQKAVRQIVVNPAKKAAKRPAARGGATKAVPLEAEPVTAA
jgi:hypothetical protein